MNYRTIQVDFQLRSYKFYPISEPHGFTCSEPCRGDIKKPIFCELPRLGIYNMNFLIAYVISFVSGTMIFFSQGSAAKSYPSSFQSLAH